MATPDGEGRRAQSPSSQPLRSLVDVLQALGPLELAEDWDNVGLLFGQLEQPIERAVVCNDLSQAVVDEAAALGRLEHTLFVAYHPPWFRPLRRLIGPGPLFDVCSQGSALYSPHTALDAAPMGPNAQLASRLGLVAVRPLVPHPQAGAGPAVGQGRLGELAAPMALSEIVARCLTASGSEGALVAEAPSARSNEAVIRRVAIAAGAGRGLLAAALAAEADLLVTEELPHHDALRATQAGLSIVALRHSVSERLCLAGIGSALRDRFAGFPVISSKADRDPYTFAMAR